MTKRSLTLHFIRHGETYFNFYDRTQGWGDSPLTEQGIKDTVKSARGLKDLKFDAVYSSDLGRTIETAEIFIEENEQSDKEQAIHRMRDFREIFFGSFEGGQNDDAFMAAADYLGYESKEELLKHTHDSDRMEVFKKLCPHGHPETYEEFTSRLERGLDKVLENHKATNDNILIVAHGGTIRLLLEKILPELGKAVPIENASVSTVHYEKGEFKLDRYGDTSHFVSEEEE